MSRCDFGLLAGTATHAADRLAGVPLALPVLSLITTLCVQALAKPVAHRPIVISERDHYGMCPE